MYLTFEQAYSKIMNKPNVGVVPPPAHPPPLDKNPQENLPLKDDRKLSTAPSAPLRRPFVKMTLADVRMKEVLGKGTYGTVVKATIRSKPGVYAIKVVELGKKNNDGIINEANYQDDLIHPNVCLLFGAFFDKNKLCMVMEYYERGTLRDRIKLAPGRRLEWSEAAAYMVQIADALDFIHKRGYIHRDIKEANILLLNKQTIKISDFGVTVPISKTGWNYSYGGTKGWMSPEMIQAKPYNHTTDIWLAGVIFFRLLCGKKPFTESDGSACVRDIVDARFTVPDFVCSSGYSLLAQMLAKRPQDRIKMRQVRYTSWIIENLVEE